MKSPNLTCVAGLLILLLSMAHAATGQQNAPWKRKPCTEHPDSCFVVTFNPPIDDALFVPNEVTVDVPLELHATKVIVSSYPRGTGVADIPSEVFVEMYRFQNVGKYARFRGEIKKCTDQGTVEVLVFCRGFESYPITAYGGAVECRQVGPKAAR